MAILGPFSVAYPVDFRSGGDTTKEAFGKHIQEIERIYGIINSLDADKISASDHADKLAQHVNSATPHPNLTLSSLKGDLPFSRISGNLDISRITGNLPFSRVTGSIDGSRINGSLNNATIDKSKVSGLQSFIEELISETGKDIIDSTVNENGYVKFANGLIIQWGKITGTSGESILGVNEVNVTVTFPIVFPNQCFAVARSSYATSDLYTYSSISSGDVTGYRLAHISTVPSKTGFIFQCPKGNLSTYIAIGY